KLLGSAAVEHLRSGTGIHIDSSTGRYAGIDIAGHFLSKMSRRAHAVELGGKWRFTEAGCRYSGSSAIALKAGLEQVRRNTGSLPNVAVVLTARSSESGIQFVVVDTAGRHDFLRCMLSS
ncbi:MAG: hypothetical protein B7W97_00720, partial [Mycobacterium sp. 20-66-4]